MRRRSIIDLLPTLLIGGVLMGGWFGEQPMAPEMPAPARRPAPKMVKFTDTSKQANRSGKYDANLIQDIAGQAKATGVNPYQALAHALQETNLGTRGGEKANPFHVDLTLHKVDEEDIDAAYAKAFELMQRNAQRYGEGTVKSYQAFEGLGKTHPKSYLNGRYKKLFGSTKPIDMGKRMIYGQQIKDYMEALSRDPNIKPLVEEAGYLPPDYSTGGNNGR